MRYCTLIGSTISFTPRFSMQVSPSCSCSSNSKPYCRPEQPPPCTNTRSMSFGFPSPRIRSPTLRAAASVKLSAGASCSASVVLISLLYPKTSLEAAHGAVKAGFHRVGKVPFLEPLAQPRPAGLGGPSGLGGPPHQLSPALGTPGH